jgi:hypothetical protein
MNDLVLLTKQKMVLQGMINSLTEIGRSYGMEEWGGKKLK